MPKKQVSDRQYQHLIKAREAKRNKKVDMDTYSVDLIKPHLKEIKKELSELKSKLESFKVPHHEKQDSILPVVGVNRDSYVGIISIASTIILAVLGIYLKQRSQNTEADQTLRVFI